MSFEIRGRPGLAPLLYQLDNWCISCISMSRRMKGSLDYVSLYMIPAILVDVIIHVEAARERLWVVICPTSAPGPAVAHLPDST